MVGDTKISNFNNNETEIYVFALLDFWNGHDTVTDPLYLYCEHFVKNLGGIFDFGFRFDRNRLAQLVFLIYSS